MAVGGRFDLEAVRAEARAERKRARTKAVVSNVLLGVVLVSLATGGKIGWDLWRAKCARDRAAAEEAERRAAEKEAAELARRQADEEARRREREAREAARLEAEREEKLARVRAEEARLLAERARVEEEARQADKRALQQERLRRIESVASGLRFILDDRVVCEHGTEDLFDFSVAEDRWGKLRSAAQRDALAFFGLLQGVAGPEFTQEGYPDDAAIAKLIERLEAERFTLVIRPVNTIPNSRRLKLVAVDPKNRDVELPKGARELKDPVGRTTGWTVPFAFGDRNPVFLVKPVTAYRIDRAWKDLRKGFEKKTGKMHEILRTPHVNACMAEALPDFVRSVKVGVTAPPPVPETKAETKTERPKTKRPTWKKPLSDIRTMDGPR